MPSEDAIANALRGLLGAKRALRDHPAQEHHAAACDLPASASAIHAAPSALIRTSTHGCCPRTIPVDEHFKPAYNPWDQRLCVVPDGDLFKAISAGHASVVTDRIETFTERGIKLESGRELEADIIVTATGLNLQAFGGVAMTVDGVEVNVADRVAFKGFMLDDVPNFAFTFGYTNSSWTLKVGLVGDHFCRLLAHMDANGHDICYPQISDPQMTTLPFLGIGSGYVQRSIDQFPRRGDEGPWRVIMDYNYDAKILRDGPVEDENLRFTSNDAASVDARDLVLTA